MKRMPATRNPQTNSFTTGSLRVKWLDFAVAREEEAPREEERPAPVWVLRTGFFEPGSVILIATFYESTEIPASPNDRR